MKVFFALAVKAEKDPPTPTGYVGMITANSFMKREFGKKLVEAYIPQWDLTHVIDTAGAYIPGHGTPTVILLGRNQPYIAPSRWLYPSGFAAHAAPAALPVAAGGRPRSVRPVPVAISSAVRPGGFHPVRGAQ